MMLKNDEFMRVFCEYLLLSCALSLLFVVVVNHK